MKKTKKIDCRAIARNDGGRSMVEMLGVLAVIGVLSIAGLSAYNAAINQHKANQIMEYANRLLLVIADSPAYFAANPPTLCSDLAESPPADISCTIIGGGNNENAYVFIGQINHSIGQIILDRIGVNKIDLNAYSNCSEERSEEEWPIFLEFCYNQACEYANNYTCSPFGTAE